MIMGTFFILATEANGFGLNLNILDVNLINLAILVGILVYFAPKTLGRILNERRAKIAEAIQDAEDRQKKALAALGEQQQKLAQAQVEAEQVRQEAQKRVASVQADIAAQAELDIQRMQETTAQDLGAKQEAVITQLRKQIAAMAIERVESQLRSQVDESAQQTLIERSIAQLGGR